MPKLTNSLVDAVSLGAIEEVRDLLDRGSDVNQTWGVDHDSPLTMAARGGYDHITRVLLERGAHVNHTDRHGLTALDLAVMYNFVPVASILVDAGADVNCNDSNTEPWRGWTPLMFAAAHAKAECISLLLRAGAIIDLQDAYGRTAAMIAAEGARSEVARFLVASGASCMIRDLEDKTVLDKLRIMGMTELAKELERECEFR